MIHKFTIGLRLVLVARCEAGVMDSGSKREIGKPSSNSINRRTTLKSKLQRPNHGLPFNKAQHPKATPAKVTVHALTSALDVVDLLFMQSILHIGQWMRPNYSKSDGNYRNTQNNPLCLLMMINIDITKKKRVDGCQTSRQLHKTSVFETHFIQIYTIFLRRL